MERERAGYVSICVCVRAGGCVCVCEREREREREGGGGIGRFMVGLLICVFVSASEYLCAREKSLWTKNGVRKRGK